jgi:hypothetical protein
MLLFENECVRISTLENGDLKIAVGEDFYNLYDDPSFSGEYACWGLPEKKIYEGQIVRIDRLCDLLENWLKNTSEYDLVSSFDTGDLIDKYNPIFVSDPVWSEYGDLLNYDGKYLYLDWGIKNEYLELYQKGFLIFSKVQ